MEARTSVITKRLSGVHRIIAVASGKGGVGKSMVASTLALHLASQGKKVGLLDLDFYGPSCHVILGVHDAAPVEEKGLLPPMVHDIRFMSLVFFTQDKPAPLRGEDISNVILEILAITQWGPLDYLIIDMPPGLGEETLDLIRYIKRLEFVIVTTPSQVSMSAVKKLLLLLQDLKAPVLGVIENMNMHPSTMVQKEVKALKLPYRGSLSFDSQLENALGDADQLVRTPFMNQLAGVSKKLSF